MPDSQTWQRTAVSPAPGPHEAPGETANPDALRPRTRLDEFEIIRTLGAGGFGIVYLAFDHALMRHAAIKEYLPASLAGRAAGGVAVAVRRPEGRDAFAAGLESFFNEARLLAGFHHPSLVAVHRFWKANGTAYMAMQHYPGRTLKEVRLDMQGPPDERWLLAFVEPMLGALKVLHGQNVYHRDISPDNILLMPDGRPVLLDFGSARRVIGDRTQSLTALLKPNFAPVEQYADAAGMRQGPWTDLYALGATVHFMLTGSPPTPSVLRAVRDVQPALSAVEAQPWPGVSRRFLAVIDWILELDPIARPRSVDTVQKALRGETEPPSPSPREPKVDGSPASGRWFATTEVAGTADVGEPEAAARVSTPVPIARGLPKRRRFGPPASVFAGLMGLALLASSAWAPTEPRVLAATSAVPSTIGADALSAAPAASSEISVPRRAASGAPDLSVASTPLPSKAVADRTAPKRARIAGAREAAIASTPPIAGVTSARRDERPLARGRPSADAGTAATGSLGEICKGLNFFARAICVRRECAAPALAAHAQCIQSRRADEAREGRMNQ
jgi:serine/threonine protein kinase